MLFLSLFLAGFTLGVFAALKIFAPESHEDLWDPQNLPIGKNVQVTNKQVIINKKPTLIPSS
jgi:hypothetical protein